MGLSEGPFRGADAVEVQAVDVEVHGSIYPPSLSFYLSSPRNTATIPGATSATRCWIPATRLSGSPLRSLQLCGSG